MFTCFFIIMSGSCSSPILISSDDEFDDNTVVQVDHEVSQLEDSPLKVILNEEHRYVCNCVCIKDLHIHVYYYCG